MSNNSYLNKEIYGNFSIKTGTTTNFHVGIDGITNIGGTGSTIGKLNVLSTTTGGEKIISLYSTDFSTVGDRERFYVTQGEHFVRANNHYLRSSSSAGDTNVWVYSDAGSSPTLTFFNGTEGASTLNIVGSNIPNITAVNTSRLKISSNLGVNIQPTTETSLYVKGSDATSSNFGIKIEDNVATPLFNVRNDGQVEMDGFTIRQLGTTTYFKTSGTGGYLWNNASDALNLMALTNTGNLTISNTTVVPQNTGARISVVSPSTADTTKEYVAEFFKYTANRAGFTMAAKEGTVYLQGYAGQSFQPIDLILGGYSSGVTTQLDTVILTNTDKVGIRTTPTATLDIKGESVIASTNVFKISNSGNTSLLTVNNAGRTDFISNYSGPITGIDNFTFSNISGGTRTSYYGINGDQTEIYFYENGVLKTDIFQGAGGIYNVKSTRIGLKLASDNAEKLFMDSSGNIGIGAGFFTTSSKLHVQGVDATSSNFGLKVEDSVATPLFNVRNDGRIGIGTATPSTPLHVKGSLGVRVEGSDSGYNYLSIVPYSSGNTYTSFVFPDSEELRVGGGFGANAAKFRFLNASNTTRVSINKDSPTSTLDIRGEASGSVSFGLNVRNSGDTSNFIVRDDGNVGINTTTPNYKLDVNGGVNATNYNVGGVSGATGTFTTVDLKTVTVTNGIITSIV